ncbi:MAG: hypothetical protein HYZ14_03130 [Bacteroidetes bacterium]|nr:hypothetical protein [Bacteroidota bacterium]
MKIKSNHTLTVSTSEHSPERIYQDTKRIINLLGRYHRSLETGDFIFFVNMQEGDMNGSTIMYRKNDLTLVSDNYFAGEYLYDLMTERPNEFTYLSRSTKENLRLIRKEHEKESEVN